MDTLFSEIELEARSSVAPLAVRMRPRTLDDFVGQTDCIGPGSWLRTAIEQDSLSSVILFGPAGTGKTSLAHVIAASTKATFVEVSAIGGTVSDLRREIEAASQRLSLYGTRTILFVDEIHRFNRSQQDALLHAVEDRTVIADYFVLCSGTSRTQVNALVGEVEFKLEQYGVAPKHIEGADTGIWVLEDFGPVILHVFTPDAREFYNLEKLYQETTEKDISSLISED